MDRSLTFLNSEIEQLKSRVMENEAAMKFLNNRILYQDVYTRRENLRFFNIPESTDTTEENATELIYHFMERELEVENARDIRAVYTRENKPRLTLAAAYVIRERNYLYEYKLPGQDKPRLEKAVKVDFVPSIRGVRVLCKPLPE